MKLISIVSPVFNEAEGIEEFLRELIRVLDPPRNRFEIILVNDGSIDQSKNVIMKYMKKNINKKIDIKLINFTRNFGHQAALLAGLEIAKGEAIVTLDSDLQDPPDLIPNMIKEWEKGNDVVLMQRVDRGHESKSKKSLSLIYYRLLRMISTQESLSNIGDFRLISKEVQNNLLRTQGSSIYLRGAISWMGYATKTIEYDRADRLFGTTKYSLKKMLNLGISGIINSGNRILRVPFILSFISFIISGTISGVMIFNKFYNPANTIPGFTSLTLLILWGITLNMFTTGVLGEYIYSNLRNSSNLPNYIIESCHASAPRKGHNN